MVCHILENNYRNRFRIQTGCVTGRKHGLSPGFRVFFTRREFPPGNRGSISVEAGLSFSIFVILIGALLSLFLVEKTQINTLSELDTVAKAVSAAEYLSDEEGQLRDIELEVFDTGISVSDEKVSIGLTYVSGPEFLPSYIGKTVISQQVVRRLWTGRTLEKTNAVEEGDMYVYVTNGGTVFHVSENCTYLNPVVSETTLEEVGSLRNKSRHKYYPCPFCGGGSGKVYITGDGECYHASRDCSQLKRKYSKVLLSETKLPACSKCGGYMNEE